MKSKIVARIIAVVICIVIYAIYISIAIAMDWKSGGGIIVIAILLGIFRYVWKFAGKIGEEMDSQLQEKDTSTSNHLLEPITEDTQVQEQSTISDIDTDSKMEKADSSSIVGSELSSTSTQETVKIQHTGIVENQTKKINKTHWSKYRLYYIIVFIISTITIIIVSFSIHVYQKQQHELQIEELVQKAKEAYNLSFYDLALNHLEEAQLFDSHNLVINYYIGRVNYKQENYLKAQEYFEKVYNHNIQKEDFFLGKDTIPFNKLLYNYCRTLRNNSYLDHHKLMLISQEYISLYPDESDAYRNILFAYKKIGDNIKAKEWAHKMVNKFPQDDDSYFCLAYILSDMQQYIESITNYKKAISLNPYSSSAYNNLGLCYYELGQKQHAYKCWRMAYELGDNETAPNNLKNAKQSVITNKQWLYKTLKQLGYQLGTEEQYIKSLLTNPNEINWSYNDATNEKLGVGTKEEFKKLLLLDIR